MNISKFSEIEQYTSDGNYTVDIPVLYLDETLEHYSKYNLELMPDFQRGHVWTEDKQVAFVEHFLKGGRGPEIIRFNCHGWMRNTTGNSMVLVDGLQRLTALLRFMNNEIPAFGTFYHDFTDRLPVKLSVKFIVNDLPTRADVLQWYINLNSGGVVHSQEEIDRVQDLLKMELQNQAQ